MTEAQLINALYFLFAIGVIGWILTYKPCRGADICSFDIITILVLAGRKSGKK